MKDKKMNPLKIFILFNFLERQKILDPVELEVRNIQNLIEPYSCWRGEGEGIN